MITESEKIVKRYQHLNVELQYAKMVIRVIEQDLNRIPPTCPVRNLLKQNLEQAKQLKSDIQTDIDELVDNQLQLNLNFIV